MLKSTIAALIAFGLAFYSESALAQESAKPKEAFVDRDGDGICDGKEHRFHNQKRKKNRGKSQGEGEGEMRQLERRGKDYGSKPQDKKGGSSNRSPR